MPIVELSISWLWRRRRTIFLAARKQRMKKVHRDCVIESMIRIAIALVHMLFGGSNRCLSSSQHHQLLDLSLVVNKLAISVSQ